MIHDITRMLQGSPHKVVTILLFHDCIGLVGTTLQRTSLIMPSSLLQVVNSFFQTCWQLGTSSANTTCWRLVGRLATRCETFACVVQECFIRYKTQRLVDNLLQDCWVQQTCYRPATQFVNKVVSDNLVATWWNNSIITTLQGYSNKSDTVMI
jgi:hypothetical protein